MKVKSKQHNSKSCIICGLDNDYGVKAPFYNMEDGRVATLFSFREKHQSYPGRVHGGMISAMLDELGLRALWAKQNSEETFGVTISLETKFRRPVPYETTLLGIGEVTAESGSFVVTENRIYDKEGNLLANAVAKYLKTDVSKIADADAHEEMCYLIDDGVTEIMLP